MLCLHYTLRPCAIRIQGLAAPFLHTNIAAVPCLNTRAGLNRTNEIVGATCQVNTRRFVHVDPGCLVEFDDARHDTRADVSVSQALPPLARDEHGVALFDAKLRRIGDVHLEIVWMSLAGPRDVVEGGMHSTQAVQCDELEGILTFDLVLKILESGLVALVEYLVLGDRRLLGKADSVDEVNDALAVNLKLSGRGRAGVGNGIVDVVLESRITVVIALMTLDAANRL